jgi:hypothetical protein
VAYVCLLDIPETVGGMGGEHDWPEMRSRVREIAGLESFPRKINNKNREVRSPLDCRVHRCVYH